MDGSIKIENMNIPEILAPAGSWDALKAAVNSGCDAVYAGGDLFSARAFAGNFDKDAMLKALDYCHLYGVRLYMTVNTLLKEAEILKLRDYIEPYYKSGLDGVIVQDMGVLKVIRDSFPDLPLHASTQMSITSSFGAGILKKLGVKRAVPARELSLAEVTAIIEKTGMEIETFVHGAMCYAYSGRCLFSSFRGGRSGNRGRCAQPCRQCYSFIIKDKEKSGYLMSLKDMCTLDVIPRLIDSGIASFKIEGRMKNPYYVAGTVEAYRKMRDLYLSMLDERRIKGGDSGIKGWDGLSDNEKEKYLREAEKLAFDMKDIYNRGGFCGGYYFKDNGKEMSDDKRPNHAGIIVGKVTLVKGPLVTVSLIRDIGSGDVVEIEGSGVELTIGKTGKAGQLITINGRELKKIRPGMNVIRTRNKSLLERIEKELLQNKRRITAYAHVFAKCGERLAITISRVPLNDPGKTPVTVSVTVKGGVVEKAAKSPVSAEELEARMKKTGSGFLDLIVDVEADDDMFIPMSSFNALRREASEKFAEEILLKSIRK